MRGKWMRKRVLAMANAAIITVMTVVLGVAPSASGVTPDVKAGKVPASAVKAKKSTKVTCEGQTFNYGNVTHGLGPRMSYYFGVKDGKIRMVRVYVNNGSNATLKLGVVTWSGAVVESQIFGSDYCITFPGSAQGVNITGKQDGQTWVSKPRW